jgi:hypothetical protein
MSYKNIYTVFDRGPSTSDYEVVKMDRDFKVERIYKVGKSLFGCDGEWCSHRPTCRHRETAKIFVEQNLVNSRRALDFDKKRWIEQPKLEE